MPEFVPFRFKVTLLSTDTQKILCDASFSEVSGLELTMEPKVINEGGRNWGEIQRSGPTKFSPIVLKRGVTSLNDLWSWFDATTRGANYGYRVDGEIAIYASGNGVGKKPVMKWKLIKVLPTRFKGPDLSATANQVAVEELHLVHEGLVLERPHQSSEDTNSPNQVNNT